MRVSDDFLPLFLPNDSALLAQPRKRDRQQDDGEVAGLTLRVSHARTTGTPRLPMVAMNPATIVEKGAEHGLSRLDPL
jgi:hypothetical protein